MWVRSQESHHFKVIKYNHIFCETTCWTTRLTQPTSEHQHGRQPRIEKVLTKVKMTTSLDTLTTATAAFQGFVFRFWHALDKTSLTRLSGVKSLWLHIFTILIQQFYDKLQLSWVEKLPFKLINIIRVIHGTIQTGSTDDFSLSFHYHCYLFL